VLSQNITGFELPKTAPSFSHGSPKTPVREHDPKGKDERVQVANHTPVVIGGVLVLNHQTSLAHFRRKGTRSWLKISVASLSRVRGCCVKTDEAPICPAEGENPFEIRTQEFPAGSELAKKDKRKLRPMFESGTSLSSPKAVVMSVACESPARETHWIVGLAVRP